MSLDDILRTGDVNVSVTMSLNDLRQVMKDAIEEVRAQVTITTEKDTAHSDKFMTVEEVCNYLHVSVPTLHRWDKLGYLVKVRAGKRVLYDRNEVEGFAVK